MDRRRLGRTEHLSTVAIFGAAALGQVNQSQADRAIEIVLSAGVNHFDVAPSYGQAEERLGPWMPRIRGQLFLACKTTERTRAGAADELRLSLKRLGVEAFDLYQVHAITTFEELNQATGPAGALEAITQARQAGLTRFIGITGHGLLAPSIFLEALRRFDFDTVMFPYNPVLMANPAYREDALSLLQECRMRDVGVQVIKAIARGPWGDKEPTHHTWYEPFTAKEDIQAAVDFVLSQDVTGLCTAGDIQILPLVLQACQDYRNLVPAEQETLIASSGEREPLFV